MKDNEDDMRCYVPNSGPEEKERGALGGGRIKDSGAGCRCLRPQQLLAL